MLSFLLCFLIIDFFIANCHLLVNWEGPSAFDGWPDGTQTTTSQVAPKRIKHLPEPKSETEESDVDPSSDDEYVAEESKSKGRVKV